MNKKNVALLILGILLLFISIWQIRSAQSDLSIISLHSKNPPVTIIAPAGITTPRPTILIAHGIAGSAVLMKGFALTFAHAGYTTVSWDFEGHGYNTDRFAPTTSSNSLLNDAESALVAAETTGLVDTQQIAILGHSMGSGVALSYGISHPNTSATIAVSPVNQTVTPTLPHNLLLMAGSLEQQFATHAEQLISDAGGQGGDFSAGSARKSVIIPNVEHISILFSPKAHQTALSWLNEVFGPQTDAERYVDRRIIWFVLGILGSILIGANSLKIISTDIHLGENLKPRWFRILSLLVSGIAATVILWLVSQIGIKLNQIFGLIVGGYMLFWFGVAGVVGITILRPEIIKPTYIELSKGLFTFAVLWLGVGLLGNYVWLPWLLIPNRLILWIPSFIIIFPWFFLVANAMNHTKHLGMIGWWLFQSLTIILSLLLAIRLNPELGFLFILLPMVPIMIGLHMLIISPKHGFWSYALSGAMFTSWLILAVFPLQ